MEEKDSIVFINQNAGYLMVDIIHANKQYRSRSIITGKLVERNLPLDKTVKIEKIITYNRSSTLKRLFTWTWGFVQILWLVKTRYRKSDLFIVTNPPFAGLLPLFCKNKFSLLVYDVYPDALVAYKYLSPDSFIATYWRNANRKIFARAYKIFTISDGMKKVLSQYVEPNKISVIPIWTDNQFLKPIPKTENIFLKQHKIEDKFIVMYSGNLGHSHSVEVLVEIAAKIKDRDILFVIIGEGDKKQLISEMIVNKQITNCMLLPWQEAVMLPYSLSAADLAVVTLGKEASTLSVPSKTFNLMSVAVPLLCIADDKSELASLVTRFQIGECFLSSEVNKMIEYVSKVKADESYRSKMVQNALIASKEFGPENASKFVLN